MNILDLIKQCFNYKIIFTVYENNFIYYINNKILYKTNYDILNFKSTKESKIDDLESLLNNEIVTSNQHKLNINYHESIELNIKYGNLL